MAFEDVSKDGDTAAGSVLIPGGPLAPRPSGLRGRVIVPPNVAGWEQVAVMEWELTGERWTDLHPFDEFNYVLDGELHVEVAGAELVAQAGDLVQVPANCTGKYFAPTHARMLAIYGPHPAGAASESLPLELLSKLPRKADDRQILSVDGSGAAE